LNPPPKQLELALTNSNRREDCVIQTAWDKFRIDRLYS